MGGEKEGEGGGGGGEDYKEQNDEAANLGSLRKTGEGERDEEREIKGGRGRLMKISSCGKMPTVRELLKYVPKHAFWKTKCLFPNPLSSPLPPA